MNRCLVPHIPLARVVIGGALALRVTQGLDQQGSHGICESAPVGDGVVATVFWATEGCQGWKEVSMKICSHAVVLMSDWCEPTVWPPMKRK